MFVGYRILIALSFTLAFFQPLAKAQSEAALQVLASEALQTNMVEPLVDDEQSPIADNSNSLAFNCETQQRMPRAQLVSSFNTSLAPSGADRVCLELRIAEIRGKTVSDVELQKPSVGIRTLTDIFAAGQAMKESYKESGYLLTEVILPKQDFSSGRIEYQVVEGKITQIDYDTGGADGKADREFGELMKDNAESSVPMNVPVKSSALEQSLLLMRDLPGWNVGAVVRPAESEELGDIKLFMLGERKRIRGELSVDNLNSDSFGPVQLRGNLAYNGLLSGRDSVNFAFVTGFGEGEQYTGSLNYRDTFENLRTGYSLQGSFSLTKPGGAAQKLLAETQSYSGTAEVSHKITRTRSMTLEARGSVSYQNTSTKYKLFDDGLKSGDQTVNLSAGFNFQTFDDLGGFIGSVRVQQGLPTFWYSERENDGEVEPGLPLSRQDGVATTTVFGGNIKRIQRFGESGFSLLARAGGQFALQPTLASAEFSSGGRSSLRGYEPSELRGDAGYFGSAELQYTVGDGEGIFPSTQIYSFAETARAWQYPSDLVPATDTSLYSIGAGLKGQIGQFVNYNLYTALPLVEFGNTKSELMVGLQLSGRF